jgi:hypothetical protein
MRWHSIAAAIAFAAPLAVALIPSAQAQSGDKPRVTGPAVHDNLAVYFVHGTSAPGPVPLTLSEAVAAGKVTVHETGNVSQLAIENIGGEPVFVQAGDIVKGGRQDRVLTVSFLVPPNSGRMSIGAYCVERGRWTARGIEDAKRFASAEKAVPSRAAKLAILEPALRQVSAGATPTASGAGSTAAAPPQLEQQRTSAARQPAAGNMPEIRSGEARSAAHNDAQVQARSARIRQSTLDRSASPSPQSEVWALVDSAQRKLSANVGANVAATRSATSLQLALENERLAALRKAYIDKLAPAGAASPDIVGYMISINGKIVSGDVYPSNGLFRKMWPKQIEAGATEAIAEKPAAANVAAAAAPPIAQVQAFLAQAENGNATLSKLDGSRFVREARNTDSALFLETRRAAGGFIHRSYLARR